jgi:hypothetical protein
VVDVVRRIVEIVLELKAVVRSPGCCGSNRVEGYVVVKRSAEFERARNELCYREGS